MKGSVKPVKKTKAEEPELEPLCCCEYIDRNGEKNHMAACLCDCQDLDEGCDRAKKNPGYLRNPAHNDRALSGSQVECLNRKGPEKTKGFPSADLLGSLNNRAPKDETKESPRTSAGSPAKGKEDWCARCQLVRPARAWHCRVCGTCVRRMDHHCVCVWDNADLGHHLYRQKCLHSSLLLPWSICRLQLGSVLHLRVVLCDHHGEHGLHLPDPADKHQLQCDREGGAAGPATEDRAPAALRAHCGHRPVQSGLPAELAPVLHLGRAPLPPPCRGHCLKCLLYGSRGEGVAPPSASLRRTLWYTQDAHVYPLIPTGITGPCSGLALDWEKMNFSDFIA